MSVFSLAFSEDMSTLFVAEGDGVIRIWDVKTWLPRCKITAGHPINYIAISRNGRILLGNQRLSSRCGVPQAKRKCSHLDGTDNSS